jgi:hypothetical protein
VWVHACLYDYASYLHEERAIVRVIRLVWLLVELEMVCLRHACVNSRFILDFITRQREISNSSDACVLLYYQMKKEKHARGEYRWYGRKSDACVFA